MGQKRGQATSRPEATAAKKNLPLVKYVEEKLKLEWPPEAIAGRLLLDYPYDERMRISHETIYRWICLDAGQYGHLHKHLRRRQKSAVGKRVMAVADASSQGVSRLRRDPRLLKPVSA